MSSLRQTTLDGFPYIERDRVGRPVERIKKTQKGDYVLAVFGSRKIPPGNEWIFSALDDYVARKRRGVKPIQLVIEDPFGVSAIAEDWAMANDIPVRVVSAKPAYYEKWPYAEFQHTALARRDEDMLDLADVVVSFWERKPLRNPSIVDRADQLGKSEGIYFLYDD